MSLKNFCLKIDGFIFTAIVCFLVESLKMDFFTMFFILFWRRKCLEEESPMKYNCMKFKITLFRALHQILSYY